MIDMTTYVAQSAVRFGWTAAQQQVLLQEFQSGALQAIAQAANDAPAVPGGGGTGVVLYGGYVTQSDGTIVYNVDYANAYVVSHPGAYTIDKTNVGIYLQDSTTKAAIRQAFDDANQALGAAGEAPLALEQLSRIEEPLWRLASTNLVEQAPKIEKIFGANLDDSSVLLQNEVPTGLVNFTDGPIGDSAHRRQGVRQQRHHRRSRCARRQSRHLPASAPRNASRHR
jgi:hypothetical protein